MEQPVKFNNVFQLIKFIKQIDPNLLNLTCVQNLLSHPLFCGILNLVEADEMIANQYNPDLLESSSVLSGIGTLSTNYKAYKSQANKSALTSEIQVFENNDLPNQTTVQQELSATINLLNNSNCQDEVYLLWADTYISLLNYLMSGEVSDFPHIEAISQLCENQYGIPVHLSRSVRSFFLNDRILDVVCVSEPRSKGEIKKELNNIQVFPNPVIGNIVEVVFDSDLEFLDVFNSAGKEVFVQAEKNNVGITLKLSDKLTAGVYFVRFEDNTGNTKTKMFIIANE